MKSNQSEMIIYQSKDGQTKIDVRIDGDTLWMSQLQMAELFQTTKQNISLHINNIIKEGELDKNSVVKDYLTTALDGKNYRTKHYNLEAIISVGYRVKSEHGTHFRQWATQILQEYLKKGFTMTFELAKKLCIVKFFKIVQNKLHYAVSGQTASEIIFNRANAELHFMGLTTFQGTRPVKSEVSVAKNYMTEKELFALRRMVNAFFDMAELKAEMHEPMHMKDWLETLDKFSKDFGIGVLECAGTVSHEQALDKAHREYEQYRKQFTDELSEVEKSYLDSLRDMKKKLKERGEKN